MKHFMCVALCMVLPGCFVGPRRYTPYMPTPLAYRAQQAGQQLVDLSVWWQIFNDAALNQLVQDALRDNYDVQGALARIEEVRAWYYVQASRMLPEATGTTFVTRNKQSPAFIQNFISAETPYSWFWFGMNVAWEVDIWGRLRRAKRAAFEDWCVQIEALRDVHVMVLSDVARVYHTIRWLDVTSNLISHQLALRTERKRLLYDQWRAGLRSESPVVQEQAMINMLRSDVLQIHKDRADAVNQLAVLLGKPAQDIEIAAVDGWRVPQEITSTLPSELLQRRPDIRRAQHVVMAATERIGVAQAEYFPKFNILGAVSSQANSLGQLLRSRSLAWSIGPSFSWPILNFGRISAEVCATRAAEKQALLAFSNTVIKALAEVETALVAFYDQQERVRVLDEKERMRVRDAQLNVALWRSGLADELVYNASELLVVQARQDKVDAQYAQTLALIATYKALGGGW